MIMQLPHTTDVLFLPPLPQKRVLGTSKTQFLFIEMVTWDTWQMILFWSDEGTQRWWLLLNLPFCFYYPPNYNNSKCLPPTTVTLSEDSWTCSSDFFQWHSNSLFFSVLRLLRRDFLARAKTSLSGVCVSQGRDMHMQTQKMKKKKAQPEKTNISTVRSCSFAVKHVKSCAPFPLQSNASSCS